MFKVAVFVGSLRRDSINRKLAKALAKLGQTSCEFNFVNLADVPMFNQDMENDLPPSVLRVKEEIAAADAVLFVTPEYNRSVPAVMKNVIDWGSRPRGRNSWAGKPGSIIGTTQGSVGTAVGQSHLRSIVSILDIALLGQPEVYLVYKEGLIDDNNDITNDTTREFLQMYLDRFARWIGRFPRT